MTLEAGIVVGVLALGVVLGIVAFLRSRGERRTLADETPQVAVALGLQIADEGERLTGTLDDAEVQVLWHASGLHSANATTAVWAAIDPPLEIEIILSTPHRAAGPHQTRMAELGEPPVFLGGRDAGNARRRLGELREEIRRASAEIPGAPAVSLEIDRRSAQVRFAGIVTEPELLREALGRAVVVARVVAR